MAEKILVTGSSGFLGAWVARELLDRELAFVLLDRDENTYRLDQLIPDRREIPMVAADICDVDAVIAAASEHEITRVIHLAGLQIPGCRPNPILGAQVNVVGTLAVFEAARQLGTIRQIAYASSGAVLGPEEFYGLGAIPNDAALAPMTHYGVFKQCNEGNARVYFNDQEISSVGLRPWTCYGLGRDQGVTSAATMAIRAALRREDYVIPYTGRNALQYARDVAAAFVLSALDVRPGARTFNLRGQVIEMTEFVRTLEEVVPDAKGMVRLEGGPIPIACDLDDRELREFLPELGETSLRAGIEETLADFQRLEGR